MIRLRPSGADEVLIKRVQDWYEPGPGVFIASTAGQTASFSPAQLFTGSTNGVWYDPSDMTTLYQDAAGTTPVTAVEQPVGLMLDKSGKGNHAFNSSGNSANFPVLSARYNLLTKTEAFNDTGAWTKPASVTVNADAATAPNGTLTADQLVTVATQDNYIAQTVAGVNATGRTWSFSFYAKCDSGTKTVPVFIDDGNGVFAVNPATTTVNVTTSWQQFTVSGTQTSTSQTAVRAGIGGFGSWRAGDSIYIWGADLRVANDALNQPAYQRVNTSSDYDTAGFKQAEVFDGINDYLLASAGGGSTTAFFWCSAIRVGKVGAAQTLFSDAGANTGYVVRINASNQLELNAGNGTAYTTIATTAALAVGQRAVLTAWHDGTNLNVQVNNGTVAQTAFSTATAGTAQTTIGKDNNAATNFFSGRLYEKVYTKDNVPSAAQIASTKSYVANIAGITL